MSGSCTFRSMQWADATLVTLSFMKSDGCRARGFRRFPQRSLVLWGRDDEILDPKYASRFAEEVPNSELRWVEKCGHVAHLEQLAVMRDALFEFAETRRPYAPPPRPRGDG